MEQLPFPFLPWDECEPTTPPWRYRFTKNALIENLGRYRFVFGLWDRLQGCWEVDTETRTFREVTPLWMPLNARGVWSLERQSPPSGLDNRKIPRSPQWRYHTNAAFAGYFSLIPSRIRAIVAHLGCYQWLALDLIAQVPSFASFLDNEIFEGRMQYVMACLALARADQFPRRNRKRLAELIMTRKRRDLLQNLMRTPNPASAVRCLYKLGERAYPPDDYRALLMAMRFRFLAARGTQFPR